MPQLSSTEFQERYTSAKPRLAEVNDFIAHDSRERICNRSFGETTITLFWEDGKLRDIRVNSGHIIKPGKSGNLPGNSDDAVDR